MPLGAHMSIAGGFPRAVERLVAVGGRALQVFTKSPSQWKGREVPDEEAAAFKDALATNGIAPEMVVAHAAYLINLGAPPGAVRDRSVAGLAEEIRCCEQLGIEGLVVHPGSHMGAGEAAGLERVAAGIDAVLAEVGVGSCRILLETTAGQGTNLGWQFEHLAELLARSKAPDRLGVCLDTCHLHAAGYDVGSTDGWATTMASFDRLVGLARIGAVHLNDSVGEQGSRIDRHAHIGQGTIGLDGFRAVVNDARFQDRLMVIETPKDGEMDEENLATLRGLRNRGEDRS